MRFPIAILLTSLGLLTFLTTAPGQQDVAKGSTPSDLVKKLGSRKFTERDSAAAALQQLGPAALPALEQALKTADLEVRLRAEKIRAQILHQVDSARLLAGKRVRLVFKNRPVLEALDELAAQTGYAMQFIGKRAALAGRTLTLDTGETTFWEAFTLFCTQAGLRERPLPLLHEMPEPGERSAQGRFQLVDGPVKSIPTWFAGNLRLQALAAPSPHQKGEQAFLLSVSPEPHLQWGAIERLKILQAIDDRGQTLKQPYDFLLDELRLFGDKKEVGRWDAGTGQVAWGQTVPLRTLLVRLTSGAQPSTRLKEVRGVLTVGLTTPRPVATVAEVAKAVGKPVQSVSGGTLEVTQFQQKGLTLRVGVRLQGFPMTGPDGKVIQAKRHKMGMTVMTSSPGREQPKLTMLDSQGQVLPAVTVSSEVTTNPKGGLIREVTLLYQLQAGQAPPLRLEYSAAAPIQIDVPFTLRDLPLVMPK